MAEGQGLAREDRDFHLEIVRATQNSVFHKICSLYYVMGEQRLPVYFSDPERGRRSHAEHLQIFDALLRRDGNLAQALMSAHLQGAESYWKGLIGELGKPAYSADAREGLTVLCRLSFTRPTHCIRAPPRCCRRPASSGSPRRSTPPRWRREGREAEIIIVRAPLPACAVRRRRRQSCAPRSGTAPAST